MKKHSNEYYLLLALVGLVVVLVPIVLLRFSQMTVIQRVNKSMAVVSPTPTANIPAGATAVGEDSYTIPTETKNESKFVSPKLGLGFIYTDNHGKDGLPDGKNVLIKVKVVGDKVYPYQVPNFFPNGQHIEVFQKDTKDSLVTAIKKRFLSETFTNDCYVNDITNKFNIHVADYSYFSPNPIENLSFAEITFPSNTYGDEPQLGSKKCPSEYVNKAIFAYFVMDQTHPDRFFFFNTGQQPLEIKAFTVTALAK